MNNRKIKNVLMSQLVTALLLLACGLCFAADGKKAAATGTQIRPELAAKREMVRKQQEQRITNEKRRNAAEALKAERLRVYKAKQAVKQSTPADYDKK
jgi:hypothetical protein